MDTYDILKKIYSLLEEWERKAKAIVQDVVKESTSVAENIYPLFKENISRFYSDYQPEKYKRTYNFMNNFNEITNVSNDGFSISFDTSSMHEYLHDSPDYVAEIAFESGHHGTSRNVTSPSPFDMMEQELNKIIKQVYSKHEKRLSIINSMYSKKILFYLQKIQ